MFRMLRLEEKFETQQFYAEGIPTKVERDVNS